MRKNEFSPNTILILFTGILLTTVLGFHPKYTSKFPEFEGVSSLIHFHGNVMMSWYVLLFSQVLLIKYNLHKWHKLVGKIGIIIGPLAVYTMGLVTKMQYFREIKLQPESKILAHFTIEIPLMILFSVFFILAYVHRKNPATHMRYMIGTALVMIGPGLGRAIIFSSGLHPLVGVAAMFLAPTISAAILLYIDFKNKRKLKPFITVTCLLFVQIIAVMIQNTWLWQNFAKGFTAVFF